MLNTTIQSTRSGGPLAAAWAVVEHLGEDGYLQLASVTREAVARIRDGIGEIEGLRVLGDPVSTLLAFTGDDGFDLFTVADEMKARGWYVQPQFASGASPVNLHLTVTAANHGSEPEFLADLAASVAAARASGPVTVDPAVAEFVAALDPATLTPEQFAGLLAAAGLGAGAGLPDRMAPVNALLATAPPPLRERLLLEFLGALYTP
jgi:glutamate/tyrosine decarboxylase-like PLP-dependent enzyme